MVGCLHDDGTIDLEFSNLVVAPIDVDPTQSGGYAVYRARLKESITPDSTFYHSMHVVFDMNTNASVDSVYHTIYDCDKLLHVTGNTNFCEGDTIRLEASDEWIEDYRWLIADSLFSTANHFSMPLLPGFYNVVCQFTNPVCSVCEHKPIEVHSIPDGALLLDNDSLRSISDASCSWFLNGQPIDTAGSTAIDIQNGGVYQALWTSSYGCSSWSEEFLINSTPSHTRDWVFYPNPADSQIFIQSSEPCTLQLTDMSGRVLQRHSLPIGTTQIDISTLAVGVYVLQTEVNGALSARLITVE